MKNMLNSIEYKFEKLHWLLRVIIYVVAFVVVIIAFELIFAVFGVNEGMTGQLLSFVSMSLSSFTVVLIFEKSKLFKRFGFEKSGVFEKYAKGFLIGALLILLSAAPIMLFFSEKVSIPSPVPVLAVVSFLGFFIIQGASEEVFVRGLIFPVIVKRTSPFVGMLFTSGVFAALHLANPGVNIISVINLFLAGVLFGYCVVYFDSLWQACALHSAWNFIQGNIIGFKVSGIETPSLISATTKGNDLFTGGDFGVEGSLFSVIILVIAIWYFHVGCRKKGIEIFRRTQS